MYYGFGRWCLLVVCDLLLYLRVGLWVCGRHLLCGLVGFECGCWVVDSCLFCVDALGIVITWMVCCLIWWCACLSCRFNGGSCTCVVFVCCLLLFGGWCLNAINSVDFILLLYSVI